MESWSMRPGRVYRWLRIGGLTVALVGACAGCGKDSTGENLLPVRGKVVYQGEPLTTGTVILIADASKGNTTKHEPRGSIDGQGTYRVTTAGRPGAPPGWYKVAVIANKPPTPNEPYAVTGSLLPKKYGDANTSELVIEVTEKPDDTAYDIVLK
jgi:hypothetical protein